METIIKIKDWIKGFYGKYDVVIDIAVRFLAAFAALKLIDMRLGFTGIFENPFVILMVSLFCSIMPWGLETSVLALCLLANVYKTSMEIALLLGVFLLITALLYYSFHPGDPAVLLLTPVLFALRIPYVLPLIVGLSGSFVSIIPMSCGIVVYYLIGCIRTTPEAVAMGDVSLTDLPARFKVIIDGIVSNKEMWIVIAVFAAALMIVYIIHLLPYAYSWYAAIGAGTLVMAVMSIILDAPVSVSGIAAALLIAAVFVFFRYDVDYKRTDRLQFEDEDYFYYVTAIPRISVKKFGGKSRRRMHED